MKMVNERQRSCRGQFGELLYPHEYICGECGTLFAERTFAKYCCTIDSELEERNEEIEHIQKSIEEGQRA